MKSVACSLHFTLKPHFTPVCSLHFTLTIFNLIASKVEAKSESFCTLLNYTGHQIILNHTVIPMALS